MLLAALVTSAASAPRAHALGENRPIHYSATKQLWDRNTNRVELFGEAAVRQPDETLTGDYILLDLTGRTLDARGNCIYITRDTIIYGDEMHFNLDTRTGTIVNGRIANQAFTLAGERINKLSETRFQTHWGEYSTCHDCPQSWTIQAEDVDMEIEGYAYMDNVATRVKDAPAFWLPYLVVPMKTRRQSGLLFPAFRISDDEGVVFVQPYFWAINRSSDMTFGAGVYSAKGVRLEWEGRYVLESGSGAANVWHIQDKKFGPEPSRFAFQVNQLQLLPGGIEERLKLLEFTDNRFLFPGNNEPALSGLRNEPYLGSVLSISKSTDDFSASVSARRYRNFLTPDVDETARQLNFDPRTVQLLPQVALATNERFLFGSPIAVGASLGFSNFTRSAEAFDYDPVSVEGSAFSAGVDPIRKANRFSMVPSAYTTFRPFDRLSVVPSIKYYSYLYQFPDIQSQPIPDLYRGYLQAQLDLSTQFERFYTWDDPKTPKTKHLIRPFLSYSYIPYHFETWSRSGAYTNYHPFVAQSERTAGYRFDDYDIVPLDVSRDNEKYFLPLGNSLAYGFKTQIIRKNVDAPLDGPAGPAYYTTPLEASLGQSLNFRELQKSQGDQRLFSRLYSDLMLHYAKLDAGASYYYYPYAPAYHHAVSTDATYYHERATVDRFLTFERSLSLGYTWDQVECDNEGNCGTSNLRGRLTYSINDWLLPTVAASWSTISHSLSAVSMDTMIQSTSMCWRLGLRISQDAGKWNREFDLSLNITGNGFGGVTEVANTAMSR
jgi:lipopolysaccharide assembly outer membrane protein LptD (OstA)